MCGIAGLFGQGWTQGNLERMVESIHHRGPDDSGTYIDSKDGIGLGFRQLSIIDLSPRGHQPMSNHEKTVWIVFNGEVYNYLELKRELPDYPYRSGTDTEVVLAAYEKWGIDCAKHFIGMFAFAIWDIKKQTLILIRDRLGIKPLYYSNQGGCFYFGSEIKAILAAGIKATPDHKTWADYLLYGYMDHTDSTFFTGVSSLPPGHGLIVNSEGIRLYQYWNLPEISAEPLEITLEKAIETFRELLDDSLRLRLRSDVPVGVNLSGGLDSSSMMVSLDRLLKNKGEIQTFTAIFNDPNYDETDFAAQVSTDSNWVRNFQVLDADTAKKLNSMAMWHQEAPYGGISTLAYHYLHSLALEKKVTVLLEGQGVDEMLGGYAYFLPAYLLDLEETGQNGQLTAELNAIGTNRNRVIEQVKQLKANGRIDVYQDGTSHTRTDTIDGSMRKYAPAPPEFTQPFRSHLNNSLYRDLRFSKLPRVLRMNDHLAMAYSRELREPYLDHRIVEFLFRLPGDMKIRNGKTKFLLREAMSGRLPDEVRLTSKRAVVSPQREWLRGVWKDRILGTIHSQSFRQRGFFDLKQVENAFDNYLKGDGDNAFFIWQWLNVEFWFQIFIDGKRNS